jgi:ATP adenylyltransferase
MKTNKKDSIKSKALIKNKTSEKKKEVKKKADFENWPNKRNVLFRPGRYKYIRKIDLPKSCVFCAAAKKRISLDSLCVYKSKHSMIVLNKYPYNNGHILILPQKHIGHLLDLSENEYIDLMSLVRTATKAVSDIYKPAAMNLGMNHGAMSGAGIPDHLHFHIVPRWSGDLNFFPLIAETKVVIETLEQTYQHYMSYFKKQES